jgi:hypothetical protein
MARATAVLALVGGGLAVSSPADALPPDACIDGAEVTWDGNANDTAGAMGDNVNWSDPFNWDGDCVPGYRDTAPGHEYDDDVTIPAGSSVTLGDGTSAHVGTLVNRGSLTLDRATLETWQPSNSNLMTLTDSYLVGRGQFKVTSKLTITRSTQASRRCDPVWTEVDCSGEVPAADIGTTVVAPGAQMIMRGYLNLKDQRVIDNRGTVKLAGVNGVIAADDGTVFRNQGLFKIRNNRGYYQGETPVRDFGRSQFFNTGAVQKSAGSELSVIDAQFENTDPDVPGTGRVSVQSGDLSVASQDTPTATRGADLGAGVTLGNGGPESCNAIGWVNCDQVVPTVDDPAVTTVKVPNATAVSIREVQIGPSTGYLTPPVQIETPDANATPSAPLTFTILIDASALGLASPLNVARTHKVERKGFATSPWADLKDCGMTQKPTMSKPTCVARDVSANRTTALGGGDAVIVIKSLQNSRYRVGA